MSALLSYRRLIAVMPMLIWAAVLLPTLHLHPQHGHDHEGDGHRHGIVHADFWAGATADHDHATHGNGHLALSDGAASFAQFNLAALLGRNTAAARLKLKRAPQFTLLAPATEQARQLPTSAIIKREHPPPGSQLFFPQTAPRSPPSLV